jgi:hypothetical protein
MAWCGMGRAPRTARAAVEGNDAESQPEMVA